MQNRQISPVWAILERLLLLVFGQDKAVSTMVSTVFIAHNAHVRFVGHLIKILLTFNFLAKTDFQFCIFSNITKSGNRFCVVSKGSWTILTCSRPMNFTLCYHSFLFSISALNPLTSSQIVKQLSKYDFCKLLNWKAGIDWFYLIKIYFADVGEVHKYCKQSNR